MYANCMQILPSIIIVLDTRRIKKNGRYPAKARITFMREQKYYSTSLDFTIQEFENIERLNVIQKALSFFVDGAFGIVLSPEIKNN